VLTAAKQASHRKNCDGPDKPKELSYRG